MAHKMSLLWISSFSVSKKAPVVPGFFTLLLVD
jgi:hypothetical protein